MPASAIAIDITREAPSAFSEGVVIW